MSGQRAIPTPSDVSVRLVCVYTCVHERVLVVVCAAKPRSTEGTELKLDVQTQVFSSWEKEELSVHASSSKQRYGRVEQRLM